MSKPKICLFVIDPQVDFCVPGSALVVPGADKDMDRLSAMIRAHGEVIDDIQITMDSHYRLHIAHARCWVNAKGKNPDPFTCISAKDVEQGIWRAYNPGFQQRYYDYVKKLEDNKRYALVIWPEHCIIGSLGQSLYPAFYDAISEWESRFFAVAPRTTKGSNPFTEHYSAVKADVEDATDSKTRLNTRLIDTLKSYDIILGAGEALSHCLANTMRDVFEEFSPEQLKKFVLLEDATSSVGSFEKLGEDFVNEFTAKGMQISTTTKYFK